jgi:hypothetical protein
MESDRDPMARLDHAAALLRERRLDEALVEYEWLWRNIPARAPSLSGVRVSFMANRMGSLSAASQRARARFGELRDEARAAAESSIDLLSAARFDWLVLNEVLGETARTLAWFDGVDLQGTPVQRLSAFLHRLAPLLIERNRWTDLGRLQPEPLANLRQTYEILAGAIARPHEGAAALREAALASTRHVCRQQVLVLYRSLLAAGRAAEAGLVLDEALLLDDSQEIRALLAGVPS